MPLLYQDRRVFGSKHKRENKNCTYKQHWHREAADNITQHSDKVGSRKEVEYRQLNNIRTTFLQIHFLNTFHSSFVLHHKILL